VHEHQSPGESVKTFQKHLKNLIRGANFLLKFNVTNLNDVTMEVERAGTARDEEQLSLLPSSSFFSDATKKHPFPKNEVLIQLKAAFPLALNLISSYSLQIIGLAFVAKLGSTDLAAAALATALASVSGKIIVMGLAGALDTLASQAYGAQDYVALGLIFQQTVFFLLIHATLLSGIFAITPTILHKLGQPAELCSMAQRYIIALIPWLLTDAINRPLNRILVAQQITNPQAVVQLFVAAQHIPTTYLCIHIFKMGYIGAAISSGWANLLSMVLLMAWVYREGIEERVWGRQFYDIFTILILDNPPVSWSKFTKLAYASAAMKCIESWSFSICTIAAGFLPDATESVAAIGLAFNLYGILYMLFSSLAMVLNSRVGAGIGSRNSQRVIDALKAACILVPSAWLAVSFMLIFPPSQALLLSIFTDGKDALLIKQVKSLLWLVVVLEAFDGAQTVMAGVLTGAGKQAAGAVINAASYWVVALPIAMMLAFVAQQGVVGMYTGMILGPMMQSVFSGRLIFNIDWSRESGVL
jgi:multidrug resistance protein, MATE family